MLPRLAIHTQTTKPLALADAIAAYRAAGVAGISVWREHLAPVGVVEAARLLRDSGMRVPALVRAGFFVHASAEARAAAIADARRAIADAAAINAEMLVVVPGSQPAIPLALGREMVAAALAQLLPDAERHHVKLALEPLHPFYAADRSCVTTLAQARDIVLALNHPLLGVALDVYHVYWDASLWELIPELARAGKLFAFHVCDFKPHAADPLTDRGLMGEGVIPIRRIREAMDAAGYTGMIEVEIFSEKYWGWEQHAYIEKIKAAYLEHV